MAKENKNIVISSIPCRVKNLIPIIDLLYNQCDYIYLSLNKYRDIPHFLEKYNKIKCFLNFNNELGNCYRWINIGDIKGYIFSIDDDILYPLDYIENKIYNIEKYNRKSIISLQGKNIINPFKDFFCDLKKVSNFRHSLSKDICVDIIGGGVSSFHTDYMKIDLNFPESYSNDIYLSYLSYKYGLKRVCIKRGKPFLQSIETDSDTIFNKTKKDKKYKEVKENDIRKFILPYLSFK